MSGTLGTYRLAPALLALVVILTGAGPLLAHLCGGDALHAAAMETAEMDPAHPCCGGPCPGHPGHPSDFSNEAPADDACCVIAPTAPAESAAVAAPAAPGVDVALFAVVTTAWANVTEPKPVRPTPADTGPPPHVRPHLALSILLI